MCSLAPLPIEKLLVQHNSTCFAGMSAHCNSSQRTTEPAEAEGCSTPVQPKAQSCASCSQYDTHFTDEPVEWQMMLRYLCPSQPSSTITYLRHKTTGSFVKAHTCYCIVLLTS